jgi:L-threonylcarbamoyladenylate synthase
MIIDVATAVRLLKQGDVVGLPTETVYGLAASLFNDLALKKIFSVKERPFFDPLIVHISEINELQTLASDIPACVPQLAETFWPGPLTLILKKNKRVPDIVTAGLPSVGIRMPRHPVALDILRKTGPLAAPSANRFGKTSPTQAAHVESEFAGQVAVVDGGACEIGIESTILRIEENSDKIDVFILRPGAISEQDIAAALAGIKKQIHFHKATSSAAPGQLENHYQPSTPLILAEHKLSWTPEVHTLINAQLSGNYDVPTESWNFANEKPEIVARSLYSEMRRQSEKNNSYIYLELPHDYEAERWEALRDRLQKASSLRLKILQGRISALVKNK